MPFVSKKKLYKIRAETWLAACSFEQHRTHFYLTVATDAAIDAQTEHGEAIAQAMAIISNQIETDGIIPMYAASTYLDDVAKVIDPIFDATKLL